MADDKSNPDATLLEKLDELLKEHDDLLKERIRLETMFTHAGPFRCGNFGIAITRTFAWRILSNECDLWQSFQIFNLRFYKYTR